MATLMPNSDQYLYTELLRDANLGEYVKVREMLVFRYLCDPILRHRLNSVINDPEAMQGFVESSEIAFRKKSMLHSMFAFICIILAIFAQLDCAHSYYPSILRLNHT